ncbi:MAG: type I-B CRISPR-associated protein Cas7/Cst2/DevR [Theionarchaea archaeon]|nr:type I-B CRISPR-associated protein Cas7/Cst2/DevR [Theionarchaea archaeon]
MKGISIVWLSETDLTNLNSGEGESNYIDVKKYKSEGMEFPYVSGQAMRYYIKEAIRRNLSDKEYMCVPDDRGETCGDIKKCLTCDLFGFMRPFEGPARGGGGAYIRTSPVKVSPAVGLLPFEDNSVIDFLTRRHRGEKLEGDIVNIEIGTNIYKCGISVDINRIGGEENVDQPTRTMKIEYEIDAHNRKSRIVKVLEALRFLTDYSKQARLLTDFTPDLICVAFQNVYSHRLQKLFSFTGDNGSIQKTVDTERFKEILSDVKEYSDKILLGSISGILQNQMEVGEAYKEIIGSSAVVMEPKDAIREAIKYMEQQNLQ